MCSQRVQRDGDPPPIDMVSLSRAVNSNVSDVVVLKSYMNSNLVAASNLSRAKGHLMYSSAGTSTCGYVSTSGLTYMWGANNYGQLGNNNVGTNSQTPAQISTSGSLVSKTVTSISCGYGHTIALDTTGSLHAWGYNNQAQLGNDSYGTGASSPIPVQISTFGSLVSKTITSIACGASHTMALDTIGSLHSWGYNINGQLGNNSVTQSQIPVQISTFGSIVSKTITSMSCGYGHTIVLDTTGSLHAWGLNNYGQLGNNNTGTDSHIPVQISTRGSLVSKVVTSTASGYYHTIALDTSGSLHAWGYNLNGQIGNNDQNGSIFQIPVQISTFGSLVSKVVTSIACGAHHSIAIDTTGSLHAWGNNLYGQLGNASQTDSIIPIQISTYGSLVSKNITSIAGGFYHTIGLDTTGSIHTWGFNSSGQLGNASLTNSQIPILVPNSTSFTNFTGQHRCFVENYSDNLSEIEGLIVCANNNKYNTTSVNLGGDSAFTVGLSAITINDSLPLVSLAQKANDKTVFGVVSLKPNISYGTPEFNPVQLSKVGDLRAEINAVGEVGLKCRQMSLFLFRL